MAPNLLHSLTVTHRLGRSRSRKRSAPAETWVIETCQRELTISFGPPDSEPHLDDETAEGLHAYRLLLEVATGLRSAVAGETNIAGQLRSAWIELQSRPESAGLARRIAPIVRQVFADAALVRQNCLQGIGGTSYGTLARKLLGIRRGERVLIVGAGALARSVLPAFTNYEPALYSRSPHGANLTPARRLFGPGEEAAAADWAGHVIFCSPLNPTLESTWLPLLAHRPLLVALHLGARATDTLPRCLGPGRLLTLDDLFALSQSQLVTRERRLNAAREACAQSALAYAQPDSRHFDALA